MKPPEPLITPLKVVELEVPAVRVLAPKVTKLPDAPLKSPMVRFPLAAEISKVAAALRETALFAEIEPEPVRASVPPVMEVAPV